jgi:isopentenyl diphosphate isomerase/L-lactate dehydrogenase-like FMN-dependent dehydrogenase
MPFTRRQALLAGGIAAAGSLPALEAPVASSARQPQLIGPELACLTDFEPVAKARMPLPAWEYINGAAADELTVRWNREAYQKIRLKPKVLVDVSAIDTSILLFGNKLAFPILLAPTAYHKLVHPDGEIATVRGAGRAAAILIASSFATATIEEMAAAASGVVNFGRRFRPLPGQNCTPVHTKAVLIGRPYVYGLSVAGEAGVARVVEILRTELEMAMGLTGRPTITSIDPSVLWNRPS